MGEVKAYLDYIEGEKGQAIVSELGFVPLKVAARTGGSAAPKS